PEQEEIPHVDNIDSLLDNVDHYTNQGRNLDLDIKLDLQQNTEDDLGHPDDGDGDGDGDIGGDSNINGDGDGDVDRDGNINGDGDDVNGDSNRNVDCSDGGGDGNVNRNVDGDSDSDSDKDNDDSEASFETIAKAVKAAEVHARKPGTVRGYNRFVAVITSFFPK
ncbi:hypothetical protein HK102_004637, partial [Quaeritorhiza haematococci]